MLLVVSLSVLFGVVGGVSASSTSNLTFYFNIVPVIRPDCNFTFVLTTQNSSPSASFQLSFDILNLLNNETVASVDSEEVVPGGGGKEEVSVWIPRDVSLGPFALRTRSFRLNHTHHPPHLEEETLHKLEVDLRNSTILIHLNKGAYEYVQGDTVEFSVFVLDKQRRPFRTEKNVSISIWKTSPEHFLIRRFPAVSIHPERPFVTGAFQIPWTFYEKSSTDEQFQILVTLDERSTDDPSRRQGLTVPQSINELKILDLQDGFLFYSCGFVKVSVETRSSIGRVSATLRTLFVTLDNPQVDVEVKVTNPLGLPSTSGHCEFKFSSWAPSTCFTQLNHTVNFIAGRLETRVDLSATFDLDFLRKNVFPTKPTFLLSYLSLEPPLYVTCTDNEFPESVFLEDSMEPSLSAGNFLVSHVSVNSPAPSLLLRVTQNDHFPVGSEVTAGTTLQVTYVFHNGSQVSVNESVLEGGIAEHVLRDLVDHSDLSHLTAEFKDSGPLRINKCGGCPEKVKSRSSPAMWLTHYNQKTFVSGRSGEVTVVSTSPVTNFHLQFTNLFGDIWESLEPVAPSRVSSSRFVTYVNLTFPHSVTRVEFLEGSLFFGVNPESFPPVKINDAGKPLLVVSPPKTAAGVKVLGVLARTHSANEDLFPNPTFSHSFSPFYKKVHWCRIASGDVENTRWRSSCAASSFEGDPSRERIIFAQLEDVEITGGGAEDIPVWLNFEGMSRDFADWWVWNSSSLTSLDSLSIRTSLPAGVTWVQDVYGVLIDAVHGYQVTQPATFDPKVPFGLYMWPRNSTEPEIQRFTLVNHSNKTLSNVTLFQTDLNKRVVFQGSLGEESFASNTSLPFDIPPFTQRAFNTSFRRYRPGVVNFHAVASVEDHQSAVQTKFHSHSRSTDFTAIFDVFVDNANHRGSSMNLTIPEDVAQQLKPNTTYHVDVSISFNFLHSYAGYLLSYPVSSKHPNYPFVAGVRPLHASLGMLTPTSQFALKNFVTSKLESMNVSNLAGPINSPPIILQSLLDLYDLEPGVVNLNAVSELTHLVLHGFLPQVIHKRSTENSSNVNKEIIPCVQTILALQATLKHSDLIFAPNSSLEQTISRAVADGTEVIVEAVLNSTESVDILATTHLLQQLGHSRAPEFLARASPIISQILLEERNLRQERRLPVKKATEVTFALFIQSNCGKFKEAMMLARLLNMQLSSYSKYLPLQALTTFAIGSGSGKFVNERISVRPKSAVWKLGDDFGLTVTGKGIGLAGIRMFECNNEVLNKVS